MLILGNAVQSEHIKARQHLLPGEPALQSLFTILSLVHANLY